MAAKKVSLKLLVDKKANRVLFAEAGKDFIDFLFNTLSLPLGTIIRLLTNQETEGSFGNVYESIKNLNENFIQPNQEKDTLLKPKSLTSNLADQVPILPLDDAPITTPVDCADANKCFYNCGNCPYYYTDIYRTYCPSCNRKMKSVMTYVDPTKAGKNGVATGGGGGGFVKGVVTYMVMDDLVVMPLSTISSINLLQKFNVVNISSLEERVVDVGMNEGVKLLKESLQSKIVLTNVFLK